MTLQQLLIILWSRKWLMIGALMTTVVTTLIVSLMLPKQYVATASVVVDPRAVDPLTGMSLPMQLLPGYMATQVDIIASHNVSRKVVDVLKLDENEELKESFALEETTRNIKDWAAKLLLENLEITPSRESSLIQISYTSVDPQFAAITANAFAEAYIQTSIELRAQPARISADWFDDQLNSLREHMENAQSKLSSYQQEYRIVAVDDRLDIENARLNDLSRQLVESQALTNELQSRKDLLTGILKSGESSESLYEVLNNPLIQSLKSELTRAEVRFAELSKRLDINHPQYRQTEAEIDSFKKKLQSEIQMVLNSMHSGLSSSKKRDAILADTLAEQKTKVLELKKQHDEIAVLSREVENAQKAYDAAMQRSIQTRMESEISQANIAILNRAIAPDKPDKPKKLLNLLVATFLGGLLGVGSALLAELIDRRVRSAQDIAQMLSLPVFAVIKTPSAQMNLLGKS